MEENPYRAPAANAECGPLTLTPKIRSLLLALVILGSYFTLLALMFLTFELYWG